MWFNKKKKEQPKAVIDKWSPPNPYRPQKILDYTQPHSVDFLLDPLSPIYYSTSYDACPHESNPHSTHCDHSSNSSYDSSSSSDNGSSYDSGSSSSSFD